MMRGPLVALGSLLTLALCAHFGGELSAQPDSFDADRLDISIVTFGAVSVSEAGQTSKAQHAKQGYEVMVGGWAQDLEGVERMELVLPEAPPMVFSPGAVDEEGYQEWRHGEVEGVPSASLEISFVLRTGVRVIMRPQLDVEPPLVEALSQL